MINYVRLFTEAMPFSKAAIFDRSAAASVPGMQTLTITCHFVLKQICVN